MQTYFSQNRLGRSLASRSAALFLAAGLAILAGCGSGSGLSNSTTSGTTTGTTGTTATPSAPTLTLALTNAAGATVTSISMDAPATVKATLKDAAGAVIPNSVVAFSTDATLAAIIPAATALTNASGVATVTLKPATNLAVGATTITASAKVGTAAVTGAISFAIEATATPPGAPTLTLALTNAAGATVATITSAAPGTVKATVKDAAGAAVPNAIVTFSTDATLATITPAVTALTDATGVATVTLRPQGTLAAGATFITATAQVGSVAVTGATNFAVLTTATPAVPTITLALTNSASATVTSISTAAPASLKATLKDAAGAAVPNAVVTFSTDATLASLVPAATALTNASGLATVTLTPATNLAVGATTVAATAQVGTFAVTGATSFAIEATATPPGAPTLTLALTNTAGATVASVTSVAPGTVKATLKDGTGAVVPNAVVSFSTNSTLAIVTPAVTALTDASGVATVTLQPSSLFNSGATTITAAAQVGTTAVTSSIGFSVGSVVVTITAPTLGVAPLSAFGTDSITVSVSLGGSPIADGILDPSFINPCNRVTFSSSCGNLGKALLTSACTSGGVATGSYRDNGCTGTDVITATIAGVTSPSTSLAITPQTTGSIQFVSATPSSLSLKGIGGVEASQVRFKVLDTGGNPVSGKTVTFGLSTMIGGIALTPPTTDTTTSDANGLVVTTVNSGTVSTPVRVTASTPGATAGTTLTTQSSALTITTGIPDQDSFTLGATTLNVENINGNTTVLTARLADHFNNPVPNGTVVNFTTEGGSIVASCSTMTDVNGNSNCSATLTVQEPRLAPDGRYTVLAYAVGEESFVDLNGNGVADLVPNEMVDQNGTSTDLPEAFRDDNENGIRDANETFFDFNQNSIYDGPDGKYSGVLCDSVTSSAGTCAAIKSIHVRKDIVIIFSGSTAAISKIAPAGTIDLVGGCSGTSVQVNLRIVDARGNPMPAGTTITVTTTDGTISGTSTFTQINTNLTPAAGAANYSVFIRDDGVMTPTLNPITGVTTLACVDATLSGVLAVAVTTPGAGTVGPTTTITQFPVLN